MQVDERLSPRRSWRNKFADAFRGIREGIRGQKSFGVHFFFVAAVLAAAGLLGMGQLEWCILVLCITIVLTAEMFNSALESLARAVSRDSNPHVRDALDIGSAAVLVAAIGAATVGLIVFAFHLAALSGW